MAERREKQRILGIMGILGKLHNNIALFTFCSQQLRVDLKLY